MTHNDVVTSYGNWQPQGVSVYTHTEHAHNTISGCQTRATREQQRIVEEQVASTEGGHYSGGWHSTIDPKTSAAPSLLRRHIKAVCHTFNRNNYRRAN